MNQRVSCVRAQLHFACLALFGPSSLRRESSRLQNILGEQRETVPQKAGNLARTHAPTTMMARVGFIAPDYESGCSTVMNESRPIYSSIDIFRSREK